MVETNRTTSNTVAHSDSDTPDPVRTKEHGRLTVVGTGIAIGHVAAEATSCIENADRVLFLVADNLTDCWIRHLRPDGESMMDSFKKRVPRILAYEEMTERILSPVREGLDTCAVFYGHPGVFVYPSREAVRKARLEGYDARLLPAVSAEDCLFADLGIDPGTWGCASYDTTYFLVYCCSVNPRIATILWQLGAIGDTAYRPGCDSVTGLRLLRDRLLEKHPDDHRVALYEASPYVHLPPRVDWLPLRDLCSSKPTGISTLYVPPSEIAAIDRNMVDLLSLC